MNTLEEIFSQSNVQTDYFKSYSGYLQKLLSEIDTLLKARENNNTIYFAGNGGSASTASHFPVI